MSNYGGTMDQALFNGNPLRGLTAELSVSGANPVTPLLITALAILAVGGVLLLVAKWMKRRAERRRRERFGDS